MVQTEGRGYLHVVKVVAGVQVEAFRLLVDGQDGTADVQGTVELPSLDLRRTDVNHTSPTSRMSTSLHEMSSIIRSDYLRPDESWHT